MSLLRDKLLKNLPLITPYQSNDSYSAFHLYIIRLRDNNKHKQIFDYLRKENIGVNLHYIPVHMQPYYSRMGTGYSDLEQSELYYKDAISIPLFPAMTELEQGYVVESLRKALQI
jgi:dTDP-4-amino-4,6-dideoxygalactose transaminase